MKAFFLKSIFLCCGTLFAMLSISCATSTDFMSPYHPDDNKDISKAFQAARTQVLDSYDVAAANASVENEKLKVALRDKFVRLYFEHYDYLCWKFKSDLYGRASAIMSGGKITSLGLSAAAAVTSPLHSSQVLSGISAAVLGSTEVIKQEFLGDVAQYLIIAKINQQMDNKRAEIQSKLDGDKGQVSNYSLAAIQSDFDQYLDACTVMTAVANLAQQTNPQAPVTPNTYTVKLSVGANGSVIPSTPQTVISGSTTTFTIAPSAGHTIGSVTGCEGTLTGSTYKTGAITSNCTITVSFN